MKVAKVLLIALVGVLMFACNAQNTQEALGQPQDYFPMDIGHVWNYKIQLWGETSPLSYQLTCWPLGEKYMTYETNGILYADESKRDSLRLIFKIESEAPKQGPLEYPIGVELEIIRDDLRIFCDNRYNSRIRLTRVYWAAANYNRFMVNQVILKNKMSPDAPQMGGWGGWPGGDGEIISLKFFGSHDPMSIGLSGDPEKLYYLGAVNIGSRKALQFRKVVEQRGSGDSSDDAKFLYKEFTEDMWYIKGVGLVYLEQKVEGERTMTWVLEGFEDLFQNQENKLPRSKI